jgi:tRNA(Ile)-lysidine synthase
MSVEDQFISSEINVGVMIQFSTSMLEALKDKTCVIACSGGIDSIVLFHLVRQHHLKVELAHVNYGLRGDDSNKDEQFVRELGTNYGVKVTVQHHDLSPFKNASGNIQELARNARYDFFKEILKENDEAVILLGHHSDDQMETFYLNLARGGGLKGLSAMPEVRDRFIRPLLNFSKEEVTNYAEDANLNWREDLSNQENNYRRNKLRNVILPDLYKEIPDLKSSVLFLISILQGELKTARNAVNEKLKQHLASNFIPLLDLKKMSENELFVYFSELGLNKAQMMELLRLNLKGSRIDINSPYPISSIYRAQGGFELVKSVNTFQLPEFTIETVSCLPKEFNKHSIFLDPSKLDGKVSLRYIKEGDRMKVIGLNGSKLLSDILNDAKAGINAKSQAYVLVDDSDILWFPGYAIGPKAIANNQSSEILKIEVKQSLEVEPSHND